MENHTDEDAMFLCEDNNVISMVSCAIGEEPLTIRRYSYAIDHLAQHPHGHLKLGLWFKGELSNDYFFN